MNMNEEIVQCPGDDDLNHGISGSISLRGLWNIFSPTEFEKVIAALEATTTLTTLNVSFEDYHPTPENNRRIVEPVCRCIANLWCRNGSNPLRDLTLEDASLPNHGMLDVFEQFLIAAKTCGIQHMKLHDVNYLPMQFLVELCRDNDNLKVLTLDRVFFSDGGVAMSVPSSRPQDSSVMVSLDKLELYGVSFENSAEASTFANFMAHVTVPTFILGGICVNAFADDDHILCLSGIKIPSVKQLELCDFCLIEHFTAALEAGTSSLIELDVSIRWDHNEKWKKLELLANFIRRAVRLNSLAIHSYHWWYEPWPPSRQLNLAIEACATVTRIQVTNVKRHDIVYDRNEQLQDIATRNEELARFVASPVTYPTDKLLGLMGQLDNCPTGRYMLACSLPEVFSFEKIKSMDSPTTEPQPKKRKFS